MQGWTVACWSPQQYIACSPLLAVLSLKDNNTVSLGVWCRGNWSTEEEFLLAQCHALVGSHWSKMTKRLPGRTENSIKNFWNATLRSK